MTTQSIDDYLYYEFDVSNPSELTTENRIVAYERLRHKIIQEDIPALEITKRLVNLADHLDYE